MAPKIASISTIKKVTFYSNHGTPCSILDLPVEKVRFCPPLMKPSLYSVVLKNFRMWTLNSQRQDWSETTTVAVIEESRLASLDSHVATITQQ